MVIGPYLCAGSLRALPQCLGETRERAGGRGAHHDATGQGLRQRHRGLALAQLLLEREQPLLLLIVTYLIYSGNLIQW